MDTVRHILAVDDEQENLNLIRRLFRDRYEVHTAREASGAIRAMEAHPIELVLCDQRMPGRTGVELLEEIRERWPSAARILVTAYADIDAAVEAINRGQVRRYLQKPWDNDELEAVVDQALALNDLQAENERLARSLEDRNRKLIAANRQLESLDRMKSKLLSSVGHELKTPLISIKGYAEMLAAGRGGEMPAKGSAFVAGIRKAAERMEGLVGNFLHGARMASETESLVFTEVDLAAWARAAGRALSSQAEEKGVTVSVSAEGPVKLMADASSVDRILENLISNAIKFNVRGGAVEVRVRRRGAFAEVEVSDTGVGIEQRSLGRIFERFYQGERGGVRRWEGTGIGLSIVKDAVERHGGRVEVESIQGKGSVFRARLPASASMKDDTGDFQKFRRWEGSLLVLADAEDAERETARAELLAEGFAVLTAYDLESASAVVRRHEPVAALVDATLLPEGGEAPPWDAPWFALLPERDQEKIDAALKQGARACLLRPFRKDEFLFLLKQTIAGEKEPEPPGPS